MHIIWLIIPIIQSLISKLKKKIWKLKRLYVGCRIFKSNWQNWKRRLWQAIWRLLLNEDIYKDILDMTMLFIFRRIIISLINWYYKVLFFWRDRKVALKDTYNFFQTNFDKKVMKALIKNYLTTYKIVAMEATSYDTKINNDGK